MILAVEASKNRTAVRELNCVLNLKSDISKIEFSELVPVVVASGNEKAMEALYSVLQRWRPGTTKMEKIEYDLLCAIVENKFPKTGLLQKVKENIFNSIGCYYGMS